MKRRLFFIAAFVAIFFIAQAQTNPTQSSDKISFNGYTIHLQKTAAGGYVYDVLSKNSIVIHQIDNPFTGSADGFIKKEDAVKAAKWQTAHINPVNGKLMPNSQKLPAEVAKQLNISID
jgi:hypothetical protein